MRRPIYAMILLDKAFSHSVKLRSEDIVRMPPKNSSWMSPHGSLYNAKGNTDFEVRGHPSFGICIGGSPWCEELHFLSAGRSGRHRFIQNFTKHVR